MAFRTNPAPELLTFNNWFTPVDAALDGSGFPSGTYSEFQPSNIRTKADKGTVSVAGIDLTVTVVKRRSWIILSQATAALLEHERLHYIIAICVGRDLHEDASSTSAGSSDALRGNLMGLLGEAQRRVQSISDQYDLQTKNGTLPMQQAAWATKVRRWYSTGFKQW
ncbi:MAG TPA: hypothetical protein VMG12_34370 [Polyangiaceae bacterium]|nr:hypothetical protein [Polyangiaceae bacterium]